MYHLSLLGDLCSISSYVKMEISQFFLVIHSGFYECSLYEYRSILNLCSFFLKKERSVSHYLGKHTHTHPHTRTRTHTPHTTHTHTPHTHTSESTRQSTDIAPGPSENLISGNSITFVFMGLFRLFLLHLRYIKITNFCRDLSRPEY